jgi:hypothetical protein
MNSLWTNCFTSAFQGVRKRCFAGMALPPPQDGRGAAFHLPANQLPAMPDPAPASCARSLWGILRIADARVDRRHNLTGIVG